MFPMPGSKSAALAPVLLAAVLSAGCGDGTRDGGSSRGEARSEAPPPLRLELVTTVSGEAARFGRIESIVVDAEGREGPMPDRDERVVPHARGDRLYLVTKDALDVQSVQVYRVSPPS